MPVDINLSGRTWLGTRKVYRRQLPASWTEVVPWRRLPLLRILLKSPEGQGRVRAIQKIMRVKKAWFFRLSEGQVAALIDALPWLDLKQSAEPIIESFSFNGQTYFLPSAHGLNMTALEYPIADEAFNALMNTGDKKHLAMLCATLCREKDKDKKSALKRGDNRIPLNSRSEASERAEQFEKLPEEISTAVVLYFAGVKKFVHDSYGQHLFVQPELDEAGNEIQVDTTPSLGWWGIFFSLATDGPFGRNVKEVHQASFHDICLYLVDQKIQAERRAMKERMARPDFGKENL